jgi:hypothetical protein
MAPGGYHDFPRDIATPLSYSKGAAATLLRHVAAAPFSYGLEADADLHW